MTVKVKFVSGFDWAILQNNRIVESGFSSRDAAEAYARDEYGMR